MKVKYLIPFSVLIFSISHFSYLHIFQGCGEIQKRKKETKAFSCNFSSNDIIDYALTSDMRYAKSQISKDLEKSYPIDTVKLSCDIKLFRYTYFDAIFSVIYSEKMNVCEILDSDDLEHDIKVWEDEDDMNRLKRVLNKCNTTSTADIRRAIESMYFLSSYQQAVNDYSNTLKHLLAAIPSTYSGPFDSLEIVKRIESIFQKQHSRINEGEFVLYYYPDYAKLVCLIIPNAEHMEFRIESIDLIREISRN